MLPSFRLSRAANVSNSLLKSCRIRILICAFQSPIERLIHYPARHAFTTKGMPPTMVSVICSRAHCTRSLRLVSSRTSCSRLRRQRSARSCARIVSNRSAFNPARRVH